MPNEGAANQADLNPSETFKTQNLLTIDSLSAAFEDRTVYSVIWHRLAMTHLAFRNLSHVLLSLFMFLVT